MSSTSGGVPGQDAAAKAHVSLEEAHDIPEAQGAQRMASESTSPTNRDPVSSTNSGLLGVVAVASNGSSDTLSEEMDPVSSTGQQKADEHWTGAISSIAATPGSVSTSQVSASVYDDSKLDSASSKRNHSGDQECGEAMEGRETDGDAKPEQRTIYETSHVTNASATDSMLETALKTSDDITQTPPPHVPARRRVKVYTLSAKTGAWDDQGTGSVDIRAWDHEVRLISYTPHFAASLLHRYPQDTLPTRISSTPLAFQYPAGAKFAYASSPHPHSPPHESSQPLTLSLWPPSAFCPLSLKNTHTVLDNSEHKLTHPLSSVPLAFVAGNCRYL